ncbi:hypothetical protein HMPREF0290_1319 [Corynebacterium efficiens YS-314]|uniref:hypothetical protein n=1 Tax=Corynebacterium efficiens TaxID=152794 RepID=UPI0001B86CD8|nr:hypothetical protein [Corynebacterium efficiens]EEW50085.1 hypothetical protein HMPREF0290_1319 [Corynebacterium efficiens YS-314]
MPNTVRTPSPDFIIDSARDRYYRLLISDHPDVLPFIRDIPLDNISSTAIQTLADPTVPRTVVESLLIPTNGGDTVSVVVGTTVVGTLPDPSVVSDSQIARVYASGLIPTCKLVLTPAQHPAAHISLYKSDGGVPFNNPPAKPWALLPDGSMWRVEPTRHSPFRNIRDESRVLVELRAVDEIIFVYLDGRECGILDVDAADALRGAVQTAVKDGFIPIARGCVERRDDDTISLHINALAFPLWRREDFRLRHNPMELLVPHQRNPGLYRAGLLQFIRSHERVLPATPARTHTVVTGLRRYAPLVLILLGILSFILTLSADLSAQGVVGLLGISVVLAALGLWVLGCRQYDDTRRKQPRRWEVTLPLALSVLIPSVTFASIGVFHDTRPTQNSTITAQSTTLLPFPPTQDLLSTLADGHPDDPTATVVTRAPGGTSSPPRPQSPPQDRQNAPSSVSPLLSPPMPWEEPGAAPGESSPGVPDASAPLIWAEGADNISPGSGRPSPSNPDSNPPPAVTAPTPPAPLVPRNPVLPDPVIITPPVPDAPELPNRVFLPGPIRTPDFEVPVWPEDPPTADPPPTPTSQEPIDTQDVQNPQDRKGIDLPAPGASPETTPSSVPATADQTADPAADPTATTTSVPEAPPAEQPAREAVSLTTLTGEQPPVATDSMQP